MSVRLLARLNGYTQPPVTGFAFTPFSSESFSPRVGFPWKLDHLRIIVIDGGVPGSSNPAKNRMTITVTIGAFEVYNRFINFDPSASAFNVSPLIEVIPLNGLLMANGDLFEGRTPLGISTSLIPEAWPTITVELYGSI